VAGELLVSRLRDGVLPLLRYRVGDRGIVGEDDCSCGYRGLTIRGLSGRRSCTFLTPVGRAVDAWQVAWCFQHHPLDRFRLTQCSANAFRLELSEETSAAAGEAVLQRLRRTLVALGWRAPRLTVARVNGAAFAAAKPEPFARASGHQ
jgi:phenylacetate-coenzyme A ligase PaaK-like adenylate-forming protein